MKQLNKSKGERSGLSLFLWIFLVVGIVISSLIENGDRSYDNLFESGGMEAIREGSFDEKSFFLHVLFSRLGYVVVVILLSTTSLRKLFLVLQPIFLSIGIGAWIGTAISEFGLKGIILVLGGAFPHMLVYILVLRFLIMMLWDRTYYDRHFFMAVMVLLFMVIMGCLAESYVNPWIVAKILNLF